MSFATDEQLADGYRCVRQRLLTELQPTGHWVGELSTSALSTATAVMALQQLARARGTAETPEPLISAGLRWLAEHQNADGGWGDTVVSFSNISTAMLCQAVFHATQTTHTYQAVVQQADAYIARVGGIPAVKARYGKDKTFSVPILTHCALAGQAAWREIPPLPFELACLPAEFYKWVQLPVVSYALPALIAIGQARFQHGPTWNPVMWVIRKLARRSALRKLQRIQPTSGGFLEATPLTSFVTMSLASIGQAEHPVAREGERFIRESVRPDGSWPIDTNLATWVTTLAVNGLQGDLPLEVRVSVLEWLLDQQYQTLHPYTHADPGGWAWTDLTGGVPDADDSPGALLALLQLSRSEDMPAGLVERVPEAIRRGVNWLLDLQNRDGGWPTFCRGWGHLPFDRSSADITAHALRALSATADHVHSPRVVTAISRGFAFLQKQQRPDGSWLPLWFGNQHHPQEENPVYGTSRVLLAYQAVGRGASSEARRGTDWLLSVQDPTGGWGGDGGLPTSVEETGLALAALADVPAAAQACRRGAQWLLDQLSAGAFDQPTPIGFYFAKLWYSEKLYPWVFAAAALRKLCRSEHLIAEEIA